jgi:hypothetical protein
MITYIATGIVWGNFWGGGKGGYSARVIKANTRKELLNKAKEMLADGSLDGGMGYESLIGALLNIKKTTRIIIKDKEFKNEQYSKSFIGNLTKKEKLFLNDCYNY